MRRDQPVAGVSGLRSAAAAGRPRRRGDARRRQPVRADGGRPALLEAIGAKVRDLYGCERRSAGVEVTVTSGATEALFCAIHAVVRPGDEVILLEPAYDSYEPAVELAGGRAVRVPLLRPDFRVDWDRVRGRDHAAHAARRRQLAAQPDRCRVRAADLDALADVLRDNGVLVLSDEVYEHIVFDGRPHAQPARAAGARRAQLRRLVVRQDVALHRLEGRLLRGAARAHHRVPQGAPVRAVRGGRAHAGRARAIPRRMPAARPRTARSSTSTSATASAGCSRAPRCVACRVGGTYFQLADYSTVSDLPDVEFARWMTREARRRDHPGFGLLRNRPPLSAWCASASPRTTRPSTPPASACRGSPSHGGSIA